MLIPTRLAAAITVAAAGLLASTSIAAAAPSLADTASAAGLHVEVAAALDGPDPVVRLATAGPARVPGPGAWTLLGPDGQYVLVDLADDTQVAAANQVLADTGARAEPTPTPTPELAGGPEQARRWELPRIDARDIVADRGLTGSGATVAVIDSGVRTDHQDLVAAEIEVFTMLPGLAPDQDPFNHGTGIAGIIVAQANGVGHVGLAPDARLLSYRVFDDDGVGTSYGPVNAIRQAVRDGADVISLSLTYREPWTPLRDAVQTAARAGVVVVAAAGNGGFFSDEVFYPAAWRETIAVGATDRGGVTIYSTRADYIDLYAHGTVTLLSSTGPHAYHNSQGTSYATPYVAGTVALLLEAHPDATLEQVRGWLTGSTVPHGSAMLLQVEGALAASGHQPAPLTPAPVLSDWCPAGSPTMFDDLDGDMAVAAGCLARDGIAYGTSHDRFGPDRTLTRGQLASFVTRAVDAAGLDLPASDDVAFSDVHGSGTHDGAVMELAAAGIVAGYSDGTFRPDAPVTRAHVTKYLVEAFEVATGTPAPPQTRRWFNDTATATLAAFIDRAGCAGWIHPVSDGTYGPNMPLSRVDMAAFLTRWTADLHRSQNS